VDLFLCYFCVFGILCLVSTGWMTVCGQTSPRFVTSHSGQLSLLPAK